MKLSFFNLLLFVSSLSFAQASLNQYKYAVIPSKFPFQKEKNKFRINSTTKAFFEQKGLIVYYSDEDLPKELASDNCSKCYITVEEDNSMFNTKLKVVVRDCQNKVLLTSQEGVSREKDYAIAYNEALQAALQSIVNVNYVYNELSLASKEISTSEAVKPIQVTENNNSSNIYAEMQTTKHGFNFLNKTTKEVLTLLKTSTPYNFIAKCNNKTGIVFQKDDNWFFEYYKEDKLISEKIELKF
jgi:hypothetical protein